MATPAIAGAAALARQFLVEGHHATYSAAGYLSSLYTPSTPSSALMKALLIGSTERLTKGYNSDGETVNLGAFYSANRASADSARYRLGTGAPDYHQGFGTVRMSNVFPISDADAFELFVYDGIELEAYETWGWNFTVDTTAQTEVRNQWN